MMTTIRKAVVISTSGRAGSLGVTRYQCPRARPTAESPRASAPKARLRAVSSSGEPARVAAISPRAASERALRAQPMRRAQRSRSV